MLPDQLYETLMVFVYHHFLFAQRDDGCDVPIETHLTIIVCK